jgi:L-rhamnose isomerase
MIGERVVCIKEQILDYRMKVGKVFTIRDYTGKIGSGNEYYVVVSDSGEKIGWLDSSHFKPLSEVREDKLQELGIWK